MDAVNILANNAATFVFSRVLTPWADFYALADGTYRAYMRKTAENHVVLYEWSTENGRITFEQTKANGSIAFTVNPTNSKTITLGATVVTFVTTSTDHPVGNEVAIGVSLAATLLALKAFLDASLDPDIIKCNYSIVASQLVVAFKTSGTLGNSFGLATNVTGATASGAFMSGAGGLLEMTAPISDLSEFVGDFVYDCRFEFDSTDDSQRIPLFGGTITFTLGVTR